jgi:uncharacterized membrane protein YhaH (DUF805 family)
MWSIFRIIKKNYKKSFNFKERQNRFDYWIFVLFIILITYVVMYLSNNKIINDNLSFLLLINLIPFLSSSARRLHDGETGNKKTYTGLGFTVTFLLINFIKIKLSFIQGVIIFIWFSAFIVYLLRESNPKENGYGKLEKFPK